MEDVSISTMSVLPFMHLLAAPTCPSPFGPQAVGDQYNDCSKGILEVDLIKLIAT